MILFEILVFFKKKRNFALFYSKKEKYSYSEFLYNIFFNKLKTTGTMMQKLYATLLYALLTWAGLYAQDNPGSLRGTVKDEDGAIVDFATIAVKQGTKVIKADYTDENGEFIIKPLSAGTYDVAIEMIGYRKTLMTGVKITPGSPTSIKVVLKEEGATTTTKDAVVIEYKEPLIKPQEGNTVSREDFKHMSTRDVSSAAAMTGGVVQSDNGAGLNVAGSRNDANIVLIDGIKVRGASSLPNAAIEQIQVLTGGVPARYGDVTGGVISITTRGPSAEHTGALELTTSELLDGYHYNILALTAMGPLVVKEEIDPETKFKTRTSPLGYFISTELRSIADEDPLAGGVYKVKDDVLARLQRNPIQKAPLGIGVVSSGDFLKSSDLEKVKMRENVKNRTFVMSGKLDYKPNTAIQITAGGTFEYNNNDEYDYDRSLLSAQNNRKILNTTSRGFVRLTHRLGGNDTASNIKNIYYTLQLDYTSFKEKILSKTHGEKYFNYGYLGKFDPQSRPTYTFGADTLTNGVIKYGFKQTGTKFYDYAFTPSDLNQTLANYTTSYYNTLNGDLPSERTQIQSQGGLLNGYQSDLVYGLWENVGTQATGASKTHTQQIRFTGMLGADIKSKKTTHSITLGFEYEQRNDKSYSIGASNLWRRMQLLANKHIQQLDINNPLIRTTNGIPSDTINYNRLFVASEQSQFDKSLRTSLGLAENGTDYIQVDALDPNLFNLNMFSAADLLDNGNLVTYNGYDYKGNSLKGKIPSFEDFFTQKDAKGNYTRPIAAFRPVYVAGYIEDQFILNDLVFNVGVRVDRYDANQKALKDPYSFRETRKAREFTVAKPSTIGDDYVVYIRDPENTQLNDANNIVGYRNENTWYDAKGNEINDPSILQQATTDGKIHPALVRNPTLDATGKNSGTLIEAEAFEDYKPQINVMPRISFQFPINDKSLFFAHYDVLTQRPTASSVAGSRLDLIDYYYIASNPDNFVNNANLKPQKTIFYEAGFKQAVNAFSAISVRAFYKELRDLIQVIAVNYAYPKTYKTVGNIDFGTIKGLTIGYDLRRNKEFNKNLSIEANYTLQFADGSGSSGSSGQNLVNSGQPNLRTSLPLSYDSRHQFQVTFDYRFSEGKEYNGPKYKEKNILENVGLNVTFIGLSGNPYSRSKNFTADVQAGVQQSSILQGSINGSRLPFNARANMKIDKTFMFHSEEKDANGNEKVSELNIYFAVENVFNNKNILGVYRATGEANDDGYINSPAAQSAISSKNDPQSFRDLYSIKVNNPNNYSRPRIMRLGAIFNF